MLSLFDGTSTVVHTFRTRYQPGAIFDFGISITGSVINISVNGEELRYVMKNSTAPWSSFFIARGSNGQLYAWGGQIEKYILKTGTAFSVGELSAKCRRWL